jgi:hypothetical protein
MFVQMYSAHVIEVNTWSAACHGLLDLDLKKYSNGTVVAATKCNNFETVLYLAYATPVSIM